MSPTIPILYTLLLSLISGSTESGQRMDPVALLRQTLRYWWKIYKTYHEEVTLGYCWADYLLEISDELSTNLSAPSLAATRDRSNMTVGTTRSQQNPFPQNVMVDTTRTLGETRAGGHSQEKRLYATARSAISQFTNNPDGHRIDSSLKIIRELEKWLINKGQILSIIPYNVGENKIDGNKRITSMTDPDVEKRHALTIVPELSHDERDVPCGHEFSSRGTSSRAVNPTPNPEDDDKVDSGSKDLEKETRRKVLRSLTSERGSSIGCAFGPRSFSLEVSRGRRPKSFDGHRFRFRPCPSSRESDSRVDELLSDSRLLGEDNGMKTDPEGRRVPSNNVGSSSTSSPSQFRRVNADAERRTGVIKLMDSEGNSSRNPPRTINSKTLHRKHEKLSRDLLLSPCGKRIATGAERSPPDSRGSGREAVKRNVLPRFDTTGGSDAKKRPYQQPGEEGRSRAGRDVPAAPATIHPFFSSGLERLRQRKLYENRDPPSVPTIPEGSKQGDDPVRTVRSTPSLSGRFMDDYEDSTSQSAQNSRPTALRAPQYGDQLSVVRPLSYVSSIYSVIIAVLRTLGMFVQVGRQILDTVESNAALVCTKEYLWTKIIRWIDA